MKVCINCKREVETVRFVTRKSTCPKCGNDLHVCLNCRFYAESAHNKCSEPKAEIQRTRDKANFCDYFFVIFRKPANALRAGENFPASFVLAEIPGPWEVRFDPAWGGPAHVTFDQLQDWSQHSDQGIRFYSGRAIYQRTFTLPSGPQPGTSLALDLGRVFHLARVRLNGADLGIVWAAPWQVDITDHVKAGANDLEIEIVNLWPNRLIGDENQPPDAENASGANLERWPDWLLKPSPRPSSGRYTFTTWKHWSKDSALLPSGLLGPVCILQSGKATGAQP